jgi:hypothetical protein
MTNWSVDSVRIPDPASDRLVAKAQRAKSASDELIVRKLLECWVSELEPAIAYRDGKIIGLTLADAEVGGYPPIFDPLGLSE